VFPNFCNTLSSHHPLSTLHPAFEDGTDRGFRNVGKSQSDAGEIPKRIYTIYIVQVSYPVLSNAERRFAHAVSQAFSYLSVKAQARSQASPYEIGVLTDWHLDRFL
jgi:hypothetical protein